MVQLKVKQGVETDNYVETEGLDVKKRGWTVMFVPHATGTRRSVLLTRGRLTAVVAILLLCMLGLIRVGYVCFRVHETSNRLTSAERANAAMERQLNSLESRNKELIERIHSLDEQMAELDKLEQRIRELAGLTTETDDSEENGVALGGRGGRTTVVIDGVSVANVDMNDLDAISTRITEHQSRLSALTETLDTERRRLNSVPCIHPTASSEVWMSSSFAWRKDPFTGERRFHSGVDFAGPLGTPILATGDGDVVEAQWRKDLGWFVEIDHGFGYRTRYGHNEKLLVKKGDHVKRGDVIALMGSTGRSTGPHVHYEVIQDGKVQNPTKYFAD